MEKRKLEADAKLIKVLFDVDPQDWCRYDDGTLVFLNAAGQKFAYSAEALDILSDKKLSVKDLRTAQERSTKIPEERHLRGASAEGKNNPKKDLNDSHETFNDQKPIG